MMTIEDKVKEFHSSFGLPVNGVWSPGLLVLRNTLNSEELDEFMQEYLVVKIKSENKIEINQDDKARLLKELVDLVYVLVGMAVSLGLPFDKAFDEVHKSNMSKLGPDGRPVYRDDGKVMKGKNYKPANLLPLFKD